MRQAIMTAAQPAVTIPVPKKRIVRIERPEIKFPSRRTGGPVHISAILTVTGFSQNSSRDERRQ